MADWGVCWGFCDDADHQREDSLPTRGVYTGSLWTRTRPRASGLRDTTVRIDPEDGEHCTYRQILLKYLGRYPLRSIEGFWEIDCQPVPDHSSESSRPASLAPLSSDATMQPSAPGIGQSAQSISSSDETTLSTGPDVSSKSSGAAGNGTAATMPTPVRTEGKKAVRLTWNVKDRLVSPPGESPAPITRITATTEAREGAESQAFPVAEQHIGSAPAKAQTRAGPVPSGRAAKAVKLTWNVKDRLVPVPLTEQDAPPLSKRVEALGGTSGTSTVEPSRGATSSTAPTSSFPCAPRTEVPRFPKKVDAVEAMRRLDAAGVWPNKRCTQKSANLPATLPADATQHHDACVPVVDAAEAMRRLDAFAALRGVTGRNTNTSTTTSEGRVRKPETSKAASESSVPGKTGSTAQKASSAAVDREIKDLGSFPVATKSRSAPVLPKAAVVADASVVASKLPTTHDVSEATRLKETGNELFRKHLFEKAAWEYTCALECLGSDAEIHLRAQLLNNRAACAHQLHEWESAFDDASEVLALEPFNVKALLRRAISAENLQRHDVSFKDASAVLTLVPGQPVANGIRNRTRNLFEEAVALKKRLQEAKGVPEDLGNAMERFCFDDLEVLQRGFPWSEHSFVDGDEGNLNQLAKFEALFAEQVYTSPPFWWGLDEALRDPECLRASLDIGVAYIKNYQCDRADAIYRYALPAARARGLPWNVKALQNCATLRFKQNRQADAAALLEEINDYVPPNPVHCKNLGTVYNSLRQHARALEHFEMAVALQDGWMESSDRWDIGLAKKNLKQFDEAIKLLIDALEGFSADKSDRVTLAKLHDSIGGCYLEMGAEYGKDAQYAGWAEPHFRKAEELFRESVGISSPLYQSAARCISQSLLRQGQREQAEPWLREALRIESIKDGVHPTPLHDMVEELLNLGAQKCLGDFASYHQLLEDAILNMTKHKVPEDGNVGMVLHKVARFFVASGKEYRPAAMGYFRRALELIGSHVDEEVDTTFHCSLLELEIQCCEALLGSEMLAICDKK